MSIAYTPTSPSHSVLGIDDNTELDMSLAALMHCKEDVGAHDHGSPLPIDDDDIEAIFGDIPDHIGRV